MSEVVAIIGASAGVGRATAVEFGRHGAEVGLVARGRAGLEGAAEEVRSAGGSAHTVVADASDPDQIEAAAREIEDTFGEIDIWINVAMVTVYAPFWEVTPEEFRRVIDVTFLGSVWGMQTALRRFRARNRGRIVQVGSALAYRGIPIQSAYCGAKHALNGVIDSLRTELMHEDSDVSLSVVQLPGLNTPQFRWGRSKLSKHPKPMSPIFQPEVAAEGIYFAAHSDRREVWVGYSTAGTVLADRVSSAALDHYLAENAWSGQQTDRAFETRYDNLFEPADEDEDFGTHGPFDDQARSSSVQLWATRNRGKLIAAGVALAAAGVAAVTALGGDAADDGPLERIQDVTIGGS